MPGREKNISAAYRQDVALEERGKGEDGSEKTGRWKMEKGTETLKGEKRKSRKETLRLHHTDSL